MTNAQAVSPALTDASGRYDLAAFIRGNGEAYLTKNNWASDEVMWTEDDSENIWSLRKNGHREEFGLARIKGIECILRGIDDSPGKGEAYVLSNPDGTEGSPWSPRYMKVGDVYKRTAIVKFYLLVDGTLRKEFTHVTWLKFVRFHASWKSSQGFTVANVIELEAYEDSGGKIAAFVERYWYAHGLGLVGWQDNGVKLMGIAARPQNLPKPPRMQLSWYDGLVLPQSLISPADARFKRHTLKAAGAGGFRVRSAPNATLDNIITTLEAAKDYDCAAIDRLWLTKPEIDATSEGALWWNIVKLKDVAGLEYVGFVRSDAGTVAVYVPPVEPPPVPVPVPDDERIKDTIARLRRIRDRLKEAYAESEIVLSAWESLDNVNSIGE